MRVKPFPNVLRPAQTVLLAVWFGMLASVFAGCGPAALLARVELSRQTLSPGRDEAQPLLINYQLSQPATVSILLADSAGHQYPFRKDEPRPAGDYSAQFTGAYAVDSAGSERRVLPDGDYTVVVVAERGEHREQSQAHLSIAGADTTVPEIREVSVLPETFSPNGDNQDDETLLGYSLTKAAYVTITATDEQQQSYLLKPETKEEAQLHSLRWDGTAGERLLHDGLYQVRIRARDAAGNVTEDVRPVTIAGAGRPRLEITAVRFSPLAMPVGGTLNVEITVKNTGESPLRSQGPDPGAPYDTIENFLKFRDERGQPLYYERPGYWRVGVMWEQAASPYPVRWGWGDKLLLPGEEVTITGTIRLANFQTTQVRFWANVIQEGVGFPGDPVGHKQITISY